MNRTREISPRDLAKVDAWYWAFFYKIKLQAGNFSLANHEYQVEPMQCEAQKRCAQKGAQMGWTEIDVLRTIHGQVNLKYPAGCLYLFPTHDDVSDFSKSRFDPLISDNPQAIGRFVKSTDSANIKRINKSFLYLRGARITTKVEGRKKDSSKLRSIPVDKVTLDERDLMDNAAIRLALERMSHSTVGEYSSLSTPTIPDYGIAKEYNDSDQRIWLIKCRKCNHETCLEREFPECLGIRDDNSVFRKCMKCGEEIYPKDGRWIVQYPERTKDMVGWWISQLNSMYVDPGVILKDYLEPPEGDIQEVYNSKLAMPYISTENRLALQQVYACCDGDLMKSSHRGPCAMGVDIGNKIHIIIGYRVSQKQYRIVKMARLASFNDVHDLALKFNVRNCVIDHFPEVRKTREFKDAEPYEIFLAEYMEKLSPGPQWNLNTGIVKINRTEVCDQTHSLITDPHLLKIPRQCEEVEEYAKEMINMAKVLEEDKETGGRIYRYRKLGADHYRHATNYFVLAASRAPIVSTAHNNPRQAMADNAYDPLE